MHTTSLLRFARHPDSAPCPLPPLDDRRRQYGSAAGWPVGLLPFAAIASDLVDLGITYRHGIGYARHGERLDADEVARLAADVLTDAATLLPRPAAVELAESIRITEEWLRDARRSSADVFDHADEVGVSDDAETFQAWVLTETHLPRHALPELRRRLAEVDPDESDWRPHAFGLRATADDVRTSSRARSTFVAAIRPHLDAPTEATADGNAATRFLATLDARDVLRRPELSALYAEAGSPGDLAPAGLRELAADRWGEPRKIRGNYVYRPARSTPPPPVGEVTELAPYIETDNRADAREYAIGRRDHLGAFPPVELLVGVFDLLPSDARALLAELDDDRS